MSLRKTLSKDILPQWLGFLERWLERSGSTFFVGEEITICDLVIYTRMKWLRRGVSLLCCLVVEIFPRRFFLSRFVSAALLFFILSCAAKLEVGKTGALRRLQEHSVSSYFREQNRHRLGIVTSDLWRPFGITYYIFLYVLTVITNRYKHTCKEGSVMSE